jgi:hypothetical protein
MASTTINPNSEKDILPDVEHDEISIGTHYVADADLGLKILKERGDQGQYVLDPAMRKRVLRKIDFHILPILTLVYTESLSLTTMIEQFVLVSLQCLHFWSS